MVTAENCRRAPAFRKFAEHRGARGFTFAELAAASAKPSLTELATWLSEASASGYLTETTRDGVRRYHLA
ncbi:MAG: hypothetical protein ACJ762_01350 [Solirubrobacteraceae bacterium]